MFFSLRKHLKLLEQIANLSGQLRFEADRNLRLSGDLFQRNNDTHHLKKENDQLRKLAGQVLGHHFAEDCQECGIGQSDAWKELRDLVAAGPTPCEKLQGAQFAIGQIVTEPTTYPEGIAFFRNSALVDDDQNSRDA